MKKILFLKACWLVLDNGTETLQSFCDYVVQGNLLSNKVSVTMILGMRQFFDRSF
jgi:hypothetical protein